MRLLTHIPLHLILVISLGSAFILIPEDLSALLNVIYSGFPTPIRFGMNVTKLGVGFRLGKNVDFQTLVELGSLVTTERPSSKRNARQRLPELSRQPEISSQPEVSRPDVSSRPISRQPESSSRPISSPPAIRPDVSSRPYRNFISSLWGRRPSIRTPRTTTTAEPPPELPEHDVTENEIDDRR